MMKIVWYMNWKPSIRNIKIYDRPDWIPEVVYTEAVGAKHNYNARWEYVVHRTALDYNVSQQVAEEAMLRGLDKEFKKMRVIWGDKIGKWFEDFMEMGDVFAKIKLNDYHAKLG